MIGGMIVDENGQTKTLVHYAYRTGKVIFVRGQESPVIHVACLRGPKHQGMISSEPNAVNCELCKRSPEFKAAKGE